MDQPSKIAKVTVALPLLEQLLPEGTTVLDIDVHKIFGSLEIVVSHPSFESLKDGDFIPTRTVMLHGHWCDDCKSRHVSKREYGS